MGSKKPSGKKPDKKAPARKASVTAKPVPKKPEKTVKPKPKSKPMEKVEAVMPTKVPDWLVPPPPPIDHDTLVRRARSLRIHLMAFRKRLGVVTEASKPWIKLAAVRLDEALLHVYECPGVDPFLGEMTLGACLDSEKSAKDFAGTLAEDVGELLERTETAPDRKDYEVFYDLADLSLNSVQMDLTRFDSPLEGEDDPNDPINVNEIEPIPAPSSPPEGTTVAHTDIEG